MHIMSSSLSLCRYDFPPGGEITKLKAASELANAAIQVLQLYWLVR